MTAERLTDHEGHHWPITGAWCDVCGMPLIQYEPNHTAHPGCLDKETP